MAAPGAELSIRLTPRAARERLAPGPGDGFVAHVTAPPVEGAANDALCRLVARAAGVAPSRVELVRGRRGRHKVVRVAGVDAAAVRARIGAGFPPARRRSGR
ncbi:MAG TPA: DUF167 domain-containing protein [Solirubrobacteraceae bacterium]|nr:DUF167 domain-containing protein [Solirubrobacteraceae bacterium]